MLSGLDTAVIGLVLLSGLFAMFRGLTRELLAVLAWAGAAYIAYRLYPMLDPLARAHIATPWVADVTAGVGAFVLTLIVLSVISHQLSERVRRSPASGLDRSLGLVFGLARGMLVACVLFAVADHTVFHNAEPDWVVHARVTPALQQGAAYLVSLLPKDRLQRMEPGPLSPDAIRPAPPRPHPMPQKAAAIGLSGAHGSQTRVAGRQFKSYISATARNSCPIHAAEAM